MRRFVECGRGHTITQHSRDAEHQEDGGGRVAGIAPRASRTSRQVRHAEATLTSQPGSRGKQYDDATAALVEFAPASADRDA